MNSSLFKLDYKDFLKGAFLAVLASVILPVYNAAATGNFNALVTLNWQEIGKTAFTVFLAYLLKNFLSDSKGNPLGVGTPK